MNSKVTRLALLPLAIIAIGAASGCGEAGGGGEAGDGSSLTIYSGRDEEYVGPLIERFKQQNPGSEVEVRYGDSAELAATIREEGEKTPAGVFFSQDAGALGALQEAKLLKELPSSILDRVPSAFRSAQGDWVGTSGRVRVLGYDSRALAPSELPKSVFDLTEPRWKGKVGWAPANASFQSFVTAMRLSEGEAKTKEWLEQMKANGARSYEKNGIIRDAIADGEIEVGLINHYYILEAIKEGEADGDTYPVKLHFFPDGDVGTLINVAGVGIPEASKQQKAAEQFASFLLADPQQRYFAKETGEYPLVKGIAQDPSLPPLSSIKQPQLDLSDLSDLQGTQELLQETGVL